MKNHSGFTKGSGKYVCNECEKVTRDTGRGGASVELCDFCYEGSEWLNSVMDGMVIDEVPDKFRAFVE